MRVPGQRRSQRRMAPETDTLGLLTTVKPEANIAEAERHEILTGTIKQWDGIQSQVHEHIKQKSEDLEEAHRRVRKSIDIPRRGLAVTPHLPPDLLGVLVISPIPQGGRS